MILQNSGPGQWIALTEIGKTEKELAGLGRREGTLSFIFIYINLKKSIFVFSGDAE